MCSKVNFLAHTYFACQHCHWTILRLDKALLYLLLFKLICKNETQRERKKVVKLLLLSLYIPQNSICFNLYVVRCTLKFTLCDKNSKTHEWWFLSFSNSADKHTMPNGVKMRHGIINHHKQIIINFVLKIVMGVAF